MHNAQPAKNKPLSLVRSKLLQLLGGIPNNPPQGSIWYDSVAGKFMGSDAQGVRQIGPEAATINEAASGLIDDKYISPATMILPAKYIGGPSLEYGNAATVTLPAGFEMMDDQGQRLIKFETNTSADITQVGAGGRDAGAEQASTWYEPWAIMQDDGTTSLMLVAQGNTPTMPSGYTIKAKYPLSVFNDSNSNFRRFKAISHTELLWDDLDLRFGATSTDAVYVGDPAGWTVVDASDWVPPEAVASTLNCTPANTPDGTREAFLREYGSTGEGIVVAMADNGLYAHLYALSEISLIINEQKFEVEGNMSVRVGVRGYKVHG